MTLLERLGMQIAKKGRITEAFMMAELNSPNTTVQHQKIGDSVRVCVITLPAGHKLVGHAIVLDPAKDDELIGQQVAYNNAKEEIWKTYGSIAKALMEE